ncbi:hypothetical protein [Gordonia sp. NB41Y]|uniref:hypothetical protein n=1 Tax=Gordonia sp. NB41Y TaxID=875808 RepID=UPI0002C035BB|nr:hypothetical protein [Gordonia sp. NB41Y]KOY49022.1 hypothetical protein ISGA_12905 [Gordonia sp. NB41Y]WLP90075.1 hypothetical protein Q9K23_21530 [Gordonia sp. NB41Y]
MTDRYPFTTAVDAGLGAEEFEGPRRFTRQCERMSHPVDSTGIEMGVPDAGMTDRMMAAIEKAGGFGPDDDDVLDPRIRQRMLDQAADLLHDVLQETPTAASHRDRLGELTRAVKDLADEINRENEAPDTQSLGGHGVESLTTTHMKEQ